MFGHKKAVAELKKFGADTSLRNNVFLRIINFIA